MSTIIQLFSWMPLPLFAISAGVVAIFFLVVVLRLISLILDVIPFVR